MASINNEDILIIYGCTSLTGVWCQIRKVVKQQNIIKLKLIKNYKKILKIL
jgi:hypothetical protein